MKVFNFSVKVASILGKILLRPLLVIVLIDMAEFIWFLVLLNLKFFKTLVSLTN